jgi:hypothetical protein
MTLKFFAAAALIVAVPIVAFAQSKPTIEDAQKLVEKIISDMDKLKAYCEISKLHEQLDNAEQFETLVGELDCLEQQMGSDYVRVTDGLGMSNQTLPKVRSSAPYSSRCASCAATVA